MKEVYPVIFTKSNDEKDTVLIEVPDLQLFTEGYGMADAIDMARDAIGLCGITKEDMNQEIAKPSDLQDIDLGKAAFASEGKTCVSLVDVDFTAYRRKMENKTVRRNVTLPNWLNKEAEKADINVSRVLQEALMTALNVTR